MNRAQKLYTKQVQNIARLAKQLKNYQVVEKPSHRPPKSSSIPLWNHHVRELADTCEDYLKGKPLADYQRRELRKLANVLKRKLGLNPEPAPARIPSRNYPDDIADEFFREDK